ncbi:UNVERIFIED_ORG: hypothetical protein GGI57_001201 [Rhizobium aethiopicum]
MAGVTFARARSNATPVSLLIADHPAPGEFDQDGAGIEAISSAAFSVSRKKLE